MQKSQFQDHQLLSLAAVSNNADLIDLLIQNGADPNAELNTNVDPNFPPAIFFAIESRNIESVRALIKGKIQFQKLKDFSALVSAINTLFFSAIPDLLEAGDNPLAMVKSKAIKDESYECPLSAACFAGEIAYDTISLILSKIPEDVDINPQLDCHGGVAHWIAQSNSAKIAKLFISRKFDPNILNPQKRTAVTSLLNRRIELAEIIGILDVFYEKGLNISKPYDTATFPFPPIMEVIRSPDERYQLDILKWFASKGIDLNMIVNIKGETLRQVVQKKKKLNAIFQPEQ